MNALDKGEPLPDQMFTREEVLQGLPGRRAQTLLGLVESTTVRAVEARSRVGAFLGPRAELQAADAMAGAEEGDEAWFASFRQRAHGWRRPTIGEIELYASTWAPLIPPEPRVRAALAHLLGRTYRFRANHVPNLRVALGLDTATVQQAYETLYGSPLETIFVSHEALLSRLRWLSVDLGKRINALPPFWVALAYGLMGNFTEAVVVLPIVAVVVEPAIALGLLVLYGTANALTMGLMAEAIVRSGGIQYRNAFLRRITANYLGPAGATLASANAFVHWFLVVLAGYVGISVTLSHATGLHPALWIVLWASFLVYRLWRIEHSSSLPGDLLIGSVCVLLILSLSAVALGYATAPVGASAGEHAAAPIEPLTAAVVVGVLSGMQAMYFGHTIIPQSAKIVLPRDSGGRLFIRGSVAGTLCAVAIQGIWLLAVSQALPAEALSHHAHTALEPLGEALGPAFVVLGIVTVCAFIALDGTGASDMLFGLVRERIPVYSHAMVVLERGRGRLLLAPHEQADGGPRLGLRYLGLQEERPRLELAVQSGYRVTHHTVALGDHWNLHAFYDAAPELRQRGYELALDVIEAGEERVRLLVATPLQIRSEASAVSEGLHLVESLDLRGDEPRLLRWLIGHGESGVGDAVAAGFGDERTVHAMLEALERRQMVQQIDGGAEEARYRPRWTRRGRRHLPDAIWERLGTAGAEPTRPATPPPPQHGLQERLRQLSLSETGTFLLGATPTLVAALVAGVLVFLDRASFVHLLVLGGVLALFLAAGVFPVLFYLSARRKGLVVPAQSWTGLGHPFLLIGFYVGFMLLLLLHAVYWESVLARASVILVAGGALAATLHMRGRGAFAPRLSIEVREDLRPGRSSLYRATSNGNVAPIHVQLHYTGAEGRVKTVPNELPDFGELEAVEFDVAAAVANRARELLVWVHRVTPDGDSEVLPSTLQVTAADETQAYDLELAGGQMTMPLPPEGCHIRLELSRTLEHPA